MGRAGSVAVLGAAVIVGAVLLVRRMTIARADAVAPARELSIDAAAMLARITRWRAGAAALIALAVIAAGWSAGFHACVLLSIAFAFALQSYLNVWRSQQLLAHERASAELRGTTLTVCADGAHASVIVSRRDAARAHQHAMPRAIVL
jgi:hypothetical protein